MRTTLFSTTITSNPLDTVTIVGPDFLPGEAWRQVRGACRYFVSSMGRVWATKGGKGTRVGLRTITTNGDGYLTVGIAFDDGTTSTQYVHDLVAEAFIGPKPEGQQVRHLDDVKAHCWLSNLTFGTVSDNLRDAVDNGLHFFARRETCKWGHLYTASNTIEWNRLAADGRPMVTRLCRACSKSRVELSATHPDFQMVSDAHFRRIEGLPPLTVVPPVDPQPLRDAANEPTQRELDIEMLRSLDLDIINDNQEDTDAA